MGDEALREDLLREAREIMGNAIADSSRVGYESVLRTYEGEMRALGGDPYPIDLDKMECFLVQMKRKSRTYNTLAHYVNGFTYYFRIHSLPILTQEIGFKVFKSGLRRGMASGGACPKAKEPFKLEFFKGWLAVGRWRILRIGGSCFVCVSAFMLS